MQTLKLFCAIILKICTIFQFVKMLCAVCDVTYHLMWKSHKFKSCKLIFFIILRVVSDKINFHFICTQLPKFLVLAVPAHPSPLPKVTHVSYLKPLLHNINKQKNTPFSLPESELNNICQCIYVYWKKLISEKNINPVNEKIEENWRGKWLTWKHIPLVVKNVYNSLLIFNSKRQTAVCCNWKRRRS